MSVNLDSNSGIQRFPDKKEYDALKNNLGKMVFDGVQIWMMKNSYSEQTRRGVKDLTSKRVFKMDFTLDQKTKEKISFEFYADKFISENVPTDLKEILKSMSKTEKTAHKVFIKVCIQLFNTPQASAMGDMIKKAENIKSLKDSAILKTAAYSVLQENVWDVESRSHLCDDRYLKQWV